MSVETEEGALAVFEGQPASGPPRDIDHHTFTVTFFRM